MHSARDFFAAIPDPLLALIIVVVLAVITMRVLSSDSGVPRFFGWCAVLAGLAFYWILSGNETIGWLALAWIGYGVWKLREYGAEREAERSAEFREGWRKSQEWTKEQQKLPPEERDYGWKVWEGGLASKLDPPDLETDDGARESHYEEPHEELNRQAAAERYRLEARVRREAWKREQAEERLATLEARLEAGSLSVSNAITLTETFRDSLRNVLDRAGKQALSPDTHEGQIIALALMRVEGARAEEERARRRLAEFTASSDEAQDTDGSA